MKRIMLRAPYGCFIVQLHRNGVIIHDWDEPLHIYEYLSKREALNAFNQKVGSLVMQGYTNITILADDDDE